MTNALVPAQGSILDMTADGDDPTLTILEKSVIVLMADFSGSMWTQDGEGGRARHEVATEIILQKQKEFPGKIVLGSFNDDVTIHYDGHLPQPDGGTSLVRPLEAMIPYTQVGLRGILISDGEPNESDEQVLQAATPLKGKLDVIFVGPKESSGYRLMQKLAHHVRGTVTHNPLKDKKLFASRLDKLLLGDGRSK
jgi:hypothetical protein